MSVRDKSERYRILNAAKRARGLYTAEKQALVFVADAQTMQEGVCRKALKGGADYGYSTRTVQWGLHGRRRDSKTEYPGLIARKIVSASGNLKGGRAPGGIGLPVTYTIDFDVLLTFVPEIDDPDPNDDNDASVKGEPNGEPKSEPNDEPLGEPSSEKGETLGETKGVQGHTRSCSSLSSSLSTSTNASGEPAVGQGEDSERLVVGGAEKRTTSSPLPPSGESAQTPPRLIKTAGCPKTSSPAVGIFDHLPETKERENQQPPRESQEPRADRRVSSVEIRREFQSVFDRVNAEAGKRYKDRQPMRDIALEAGSVLKQSQPLWTEITEMCRKRGANTVLCDWENFLVKDDHTTTEAGHGEVQRTWLLRDFLNKYADAVPEPEASPVPAPTVAEISKPEPVAESKPALILSEKEKFVIAAAIMDEIRAKP